MYGSGSTFSELDEVLERQRKRTRELDAETEAATERLQSEIDERQRVLEEQRAEAERREAEQREAEQAEARERARKEHISIGEDDEEDPFAGQSSRSWPSSSGYQQAGHQQDGEAQAAQPQPRSHGDSPWQVRAGRFGRQDEEEPQQPVTPAPRPAPRRQVVVDDWDDEDFSERSWLQ